MSTTVAAVVNAILKDFGCGFEITNGFLTAFATGSITAPNFFQNTDLGTNHYRNQQATIFRPTAASAADYERVAGDLTNSSGLLAHTGANYADTTIGTETVEIWLGGIRPMVEVLDCINKALRKRLFFPTTLPITLFDDGDMSASGTTSYTGSTGTTLSKSLTARRIVLGQRALRVQNDSANDYAQSSTIAVRVGDLVYIWAIASVDVGGDAVLIPYDVTNSANIDTTAQHSEESPQFMWYKDNVPATCKELAVRLNGEGATDDIYWNVLGGYRVRDRRIDLQSLFDRGFEVAALSYGRFRNGHPSNPNVADAASLEITEIPQHDYALHFSPPEAHPRLVQFHTDQWFNYPLFVQGRRPYADVDGTLTTPAGSISADLDLIVAAAELEFLETPAYRKKLTDGDELYERMRARLIKIAGDTKTDGPARRQAPYAQPRTMN